MIRNNGAPIGVQNRTRTTPIPVQRTTRPLIFRNLTSGNAGKMIPLLAMPLLREDSVSGARFRIAFQMDETVEILMNSVNVRVMAYLVPRLAFDRFDGLDSLNRSYEGVAMANGGQTPPWFEPMTVPVDATTNEIHWALGKHAKAGATVNTDYIEAYNQIWNLRAKNRSPHLTLRNRLDMTLAPAFWNHQQFAHVVPDFDQAIIDGEVPLNVANARMPVRGLGLNITGGAQQPTSLSGLVETDTAGSRPFTGWNVASVSDTPLQTGISYLAVETTGGATPLIPNIFAELQNNGITVSLSNIELARKTQAFANLRRQYAGHSDDYIIDLLMDGIEIPDEAWKQPMLLSDQSTVFGMAKRWATDGASLTESVVNGATFIDIGFSLPRVNCGGVVMIVAEIAPEQLFERQKDPYLHATTVGQLPQFLRDTLDPEKVEVVTNDQVDVLHASPTATFGYAPLNHMWAKSMPNVGGRFTRPADDVAFDEARQRIWAVETRDPVLGTDFYLVTNMHYKPFVITDTEQDHFEIMTSGTATIRGNTVFGSLLVESTDDYEQVLAEAPMDRIDKPAPVLEASQDPEPSPKGS